ncbi:MAG: hypothetical protein LBQ55_09265 [Treponema sp.]|jgi:predicted outer membrane repeat protein|nr:hypothetical protein [Treponema sp.]
MNTKKYPGIIALLTCVFFSGCENIYVQEILRDEAVLGNISITAYAGDKAADINNGLVPGFTSGRREYAVAVEKKEGADLVTRIVINGTPPKNGTVSYALIDSVTGIAGPEQTSGSFDFSSGHLTVVLTARRPYMDDTSYTVQVDWKQPDWLEYITVEAGNGTPDILAALLPDFSSNHLNYTAGVASGANTIRLTVDLREGAKITAAAGPVFVEDDNISGAGSLAISLPSFTFPLDEKELLITLTVSFPGNPSASPEPILEETTVMGEKSITYTLTIRRPGQVNAAEGQADYFSLGIPDDHYVRQGEQVTFTVTPPFGYYTAGVVYTPEGSGPIPLSAVDGLYAFTMPRGNVTLTGSWTRIPAATYTNVKYVYGGEMMDSNGDGSSWANASGNLQKIIDRYGDTHEIWIAAGTVTPDWLEHSGANSLWPAAAQTNPQLWSFVLKNGVHIYGGFKGTERTQADKDARNIETNKTVLSGMGELGIASHVMIAAGITTDTLVDGLTISGGSCLSGAEDLSIGGHSISSSNNNDTSGGGIYTYGCNGYLTFSRLTITGNTAVNGGGMYNDSSGPTISGVHIINNVAGSGSGGKGGGVYNYGVYNDGSGNKPPRFINGTTITGNTATTGGGGMSNDNNADVTIGAAGGLPVIIRNNEAGSGGGISNIDSTLTITNAEITGNIASSGGGGGINNGTGSTLTVTNTVITGNTASGTSSGGGINNTGTSVELHDYVTISGNTAGGTGGGISGGTVTLYDNVTINGNTATGNGGGIYGTNVTLYNNVTISGNTATGGNGGGISGTTVTLYDNVTISGNEADGGHGGGISGGNISSIPVTSPNNVTISGNYATGGSSNGGGIYTASGRVILSDVTLSKNTAGGNGGGIFDGSTSTQSTSSGGHIQLTNVKLSKNTATAGSGGGLYFSTGSNNRRYVILANVEISGNTAGTSGGGMYVRYPWLQLTNVTITGNSATGAGEGLYGANVLAYSGIAVRNSIILDNGTNNIYSTPVFSDTNNNFKNPASNGYNLTSGDPGFVDAGEGDYRLNSTSPAIDQGSDAHYFNPSDTVNMGILDISNLTGTNMPGLPSHNPAAFTTGVVWASGPGTDLAGNDRTYNTTIDMGAYEYRP